MKWTPFFNAFKNCSIPNLTALSVLLSAFYALSAISEEIPDDHNTSVVKDKMYWQPRLQKIPDNFETFQSQIDNSIQLTSPADIERLYRANVVIGNVINDRGVGSQTLDTRTFGLYVRVLKKGTESGLPAKDAQAVAAAYVSLFNNENAPDAPNWNKLKALTTLKPSEFAKAVGELKTKGFGSGAVSAIVSALDKIDPVEAYKLMEYIDGQVSRYVPETRSIVQGKSYLKVPLSGLQTSEFLNSAMKDYFDMLGTEKGREALDTPFIRQGNGGKSPTAPLPEIRFANQKNDNNAAAETTYEILSHMFPEQLKQTKALGRVEQVTKENSKTLTEVHGRVTDIKKSTSHIRAKVNMIDLKIDNLTSVQQKAFLELTGIDSKLDLLIQLKIGDDLARVEKAKEDATFNASIQSGYALTATLRALFPNDNGIKGYVEVAETSFEIRKIIFSQFQEAPELACANIYIALLNLGLKLSGLTKNQKTDREVMVELFQKLEKQIRDLEFRITEMFRNTNENINLVRRNIDYQLSMLRAQITEEVSNLQQQNLDLHREMNELIRLTLRQGENSRRQNKDEANQKVGNLCQSLSQWRLRDRIANGEFLTQADLERETTGCSNRLAELHYFPIRNVYTRTFSGTEKVDASNANRFYSELGKKLQESAIEDNYGLMAQRLTLLGVPFHAGNGITSPGTEALAPTEELAPISDETFYKSWNQAWNQVYSANGPNGVAHTTPTSDPRLNLLRRVIQDQIRWMENYEHVAGLDSRGRLNPLLFSNLIHDNRDQLERVFSTMNERLMKALHSKGHSLENYDLGLDSADQPHDRVTSKDRKAADTLYQNFVEGGVIKPCPGYSPREQKPLTLTEEDFHNLLFAAAGGKKPSRADEKLFPSVFLTLYRMLKGEIRICYAKIDGVDERLEPIQTRQVKHSLSRPEIIDTVTLPLTAGRRDPVTTELYEYKTSQPGIVIQARYQFAVGNNATIPIFSKIVPVGDRVISAGRVWEPIFTEHDNVTSANEVKAKFPGNSGTVDSAVTANRDLSESFTGFRPRDFHGIDWDSLVPDLAEKWNKNDSIGKTIPHSPDYKINEQSRRLYVSVAKSAIDRYVSEKLTQEVKNHIADASGNGDADASIGALRNAMLSLDGARETLSESLQIALGDGYYKDVKLQDLVSKLPDRGVIVKLLAANNNGVGYKEKRDQIQRVLEKPLLDLMEHLLNPRIERVRPSHRELERIFADSIGLYKTETNAMPEKLANEMIAMLPLAAKEKDEFDANERRRLGDFLYWTHFRTSGPKAPLSDSRAYLKKVQDIYLSKGTVKPSELAAAKVEVLANEKKKQHELEELAFRKDIQKFRKNYDELFLSRIAEAERNLQVSSEYLHKKVAEARTYLAGGNQFQDAGHYRQKQEPFLNNLVRSLTKVETARQELAKSKASAETFMKKVEAANHRDELEKIKQQFARGPRTMSKEEKAKELGTINIAIESMGNSQADLISPEVAVRNGQGRYIQFRDSIAPRDAISSVDLLADREALAQLAMFDLTGPVEEAARLKQQSDQLTGAIYGIQQEWKVDRSPPASRYSSGGGSGDGRY